MRKGFFVHGFSLVFSFSLSLFLSLSLLVVCQAVRMMVEEIRTYDPESFPLSYLQDALEECIHVYYEVQLKKMQREVSVQLMDKDDVMSCLKNLLEVLVLDVTSAIEDHLWNIFRCSLSWVF